MKKVILFSILTTLSFFSVQALCSVGKKQVSITIVTDNYGGETSWVLKNNMGDTLAVSPVYINNDTVITNICVDTTVCLTFTIFDQFGDGMCCSFGNGSYTVKYNNLVVASGGTFTTMETTTFNCGPGALCTTANVINKGTYSTPTRETWYSYTPDSTGIYKISTCGLGNTCDTKIWVYEGICSQLNITQNNTGTIFYDDNGGGCGLFAIVSGYLEKSKTYYIRIGATAACLGNITFSLSYNGPVKGCTDPASCTYNPLAVVNDGSCLYFPNPLCQQVLINEYSCANLTQYLDSYGKSEDWIELYNTSTSSVNIGGYYLSDDTLNPMMFQIPTGTTIPGKGTFVFLASGRNLKVSSSEIHTNFKLTQTKNSNERIVFSDPSGVLIDKVKVKKTLLNHSRGRSIDGGTTWSIFTTPTYGASNTGAKYVSYSNKPTADKLPGFYSGSVVVTLTNTELSSKKMYYTLNGTRPTQFSTLYTGPITISSTSALQAIAVSDSANVLNSFCEINTYFINVTHTLPVVSIVGDNLDALANGDKSLKPAGSIEYFDKMGVRTAASFGEFNPHGQDSWVNDQRSMDFVARDEMGYSKEIKEKLFNLTPRNKFQRIILRAAGDDNYPANHHTSNEGSAHLRDAYFQNLCKEGGLHLDIRSASKAVVYLNGVYWGVYDLRERPDDSDYTEYNYNQDKYNIQYILTWGTTWAEYGGQQALDDWSALRTFILSNDMTNTANYNYVTSQLDVTSLIDYVVSNSFSVTSDWLNYNTGWWRGINPNGTHKKWGYTLWDNDAIFAFYINYTNIPDTSATAPVCGVEDPQLQDPEQHIGILQKLRSNPVFNQYYISRYADLMNTTFSCNFMLNKLDSLKNLIAPEMAMHATRWSGTYTEWLQNYNRLRYFVERRCGVKANTGMQTCYNLTGPYDVTFTTNPIGAGDVQINSLTLSNLPWKAAYFGGLDINLNTTSSNLTNYQFNQWESNHHTFLSANTFALNSFKDRKSTRLNSSH